MTYMPAGASLLTAIIWVIANGLDTGHGIGNMYLRKAPGSAKLTILRQFWLGIIAAIGSVGCAVLLWMAFAPTKPRLQEYAVAEKYNPNFRPGGAGCDPTQLRSLTGTEAVVAADRCNESAEQHRLSAADLIQQTRAADAAASSALSSYHQTVIAFLSAITGFFTLCAAIVAALYAKKAAEAAEVSVNLSKKTSQQELRANLAIEGEKFERDNDEDNTFTTWLQIRNVGSTPANDLETVLDFIFRYDNGGMKAIEDLKYEKLTQAAGASLDLENEFVLEFDEARAFKEDKGHVEISVKCRYRDDFEQNWIFRQVLTIRPEGLVNGKVFTVHCEQVAAPNSLPKSSRRTVIPAKIFPLRR